MSTHELFIRRCIDLARLGAGSVSPNPMVGSVIVCDGRIIGEGYHRRYGGPHAEVNAVQSVLDRYTDSAGLLRRATIYVTLEPCSHTGKTPPCTDLIIRHGIPRVVLGAPDPYPQVNGKGIATLRAAGVEVITGVLEQQCIDLNKRFFTGVRHQRPYIILKWAETANGMFAPSDGSKQWITGPESKQLVHRWRTEEDAVLIGKSTALIDDPELTAREWPGRNPLRVVIDRRLELPPSLHVLDGSVKTIVINELKDDVVGNTRRIALENFDHYLPQFIAYQLYLLDVRSVVVEGGQKTLDLFIRAGLWDEARVLRGNATWTDGIRAPQLRVACEAERSVGPDRLFIYRNRGAAAV